MVDDIVVYSLEVVFEARDLGICVWGARALEHEGIYLVEDVLKGRGIGGAFEEETEMAGEVRRGHGWRETASGALGIAGHPLKTIVINHGACRVLLQTATPTYL